LKREKDSLSVLIASCDAYSDLWEPAAALFNKEWTDCPFPVYLGGTKLKFSHSRIQGIVVNEDKSWCASVYKMLEQIPSNYVILLLEDFFFTDPADTQGILKLFDWVKENSIDCCRLIPNRFNTNKKVLKLDEIEVQEIKRNTPYRICTQAAIWDKNFLMALLNPRYSAWYFEGANSLLINFVDVKIYAVCKPLLKYKHAVEKGKWIKQGMDNLERHGIVIDYSKRGIYQEEKQVSISARRFRNKLIRILLFVKYLPDLVVLKYKLFKLKN
jgi:hypothetical protein